MLSVTWCEVTAMWREDRAVLLSRIRTPFGAPAMVAITARAAADYLHPGAHPIGIVVGTTIRSAVGTSAVCAIELPERIRLQGAAIGVRLMTAYERGTKLVAAVTRGSK